jgi:large subunit ribosomal protein L5
MYEFLYKLINIAFPRIRDFKGISPKSFDGRGNYSFGLKEHTIFPEINIEKATTIYGMDITIVTTAKKNEEVKELLTLLGVIFKKN